VLAVAAVNTTKYMPYACKFACTAPVSIPATIAAGGIINVYYVPSTVKVTFLPGDVTMGYLVDANDVIVKTGTPNNRTVIDVLIGTRPNRENVPYPFAIFGYKFTGWYCVEDNQTYAPSDSRYPANVTLPLVNEELTFIAQWALVNPKQTFPDKIPSEQHFDQWWADYGVLCVSSSTTASGNYEVYFADWFFGRHESCRISFGANANKFDYEIVFTKDGATAYRYVNGKPEIANDMVIPGPDLFTVIRDGMHYTKQKAFDYGAGDNESGKLFGYQFVNPFGSGAKLAWLGP
jgi:hypothetical protein